MSRIIQQPSTRLVQKQSLILTQELQLFLRLIQMTTLELKEYLEEQLLENPTLEEEEKTPEDLDPAQKNEEEIELTLPKEEPFYNGDDSYSKFTETLDDEGVSWENRVSAPESLLDHLHWQLDLLDLGDEEREIARIIIGNTNEDGYLEIPVEQIAAEINASRGISTPQNTETTSDSTEAKVEEVLYRLQRSLHPPGVCARDLAECLSLQLEDLGYPESDPIHRIAAEFLEEVGRHEYDSIADSLGIDVQRVVEAVHVISSLEPKPGRPFYTKDTEKYIVPDFFVYKVGNDFQIQLNTDVPRLRISHHYRRLIKNSKSLSHSEKKYLKEKIEAAQRIIKCLQERDETIRKVLKEIVRVQRDFLEFGFEYIKPLRLKDVAKAVNVHESTVSRITSRRYIYTPQGTIPLKALFSRRVETSHGADISFERVKAMIRDIIREEPPENPYSDEDISNILSRRNVKVARRTVAKYRKILNIPSSSKRKKQPDASTERAP